MYKHKCEICSHGFKSMMPNTKTCSDECKKTRVQRLYGIGAKRDIATGTVGAVSEMVICSDLLLRGYNVFRAISPACYCDIIATKGDTVMHVEARTGYMGTSGKLIYPNTIRGNTTHLAIRERNTGVIYYLLADGTLTELV